MRSVTELISQNYIRLYWGYMGIVEKKMETTTMGYIGFRKKDSIGGFMALSSVAIVN